MKHFTPLNLILTVLFCVAVYWAIAERLNKERFKSKVPGLEKERDKALTELDSVMKITDSLSDVPKAKVVHDTFYIESEKQHLKQVEELKASDTTKQFEYFKGIFE